MPHQRQQLLHQVVDAIARVPATSIVRVAIDGVDGAGKTHFADELAALLQASGRTTIRASVDGFHNPRAVRYRRGRASPEGFFHDSYNYDQLKTVLLDPLSPGGDHHYRVAAFDHRSDASLLVADRVASLGDILLFDGIFLHRPELRAYWDYSVFLEVRFSISIPRVAQRGEGSPDPAAPENHRYVRGQELYLQSCEPARFASVVINNDDLHAPYMVDVNRSMPHSDAQAHNDIRIIPTATKHAESFNAALDIVARERKYIGFVEGPSLDGARQFVQSIVDGAGVQMLALTPSDTVVGWCDITRNPHEGFRHVGRLGMGLLREYRGRGLGRQLAVETIRAARQAGIERVELEVFASNTSAIGLYRSLGFVTEGTKRRARKLDGEYDDNVVMALVEDK